MAAPPADYDYLIKLLLVGDSGVGKSCLLSRFSDGSFTTIIKKSKLCQYSIELDGKRIKLQMYEYDTPGQERYQTVATSYYRGAMGFLLVYDVTDESSFNSIRNWIRNIEKYASDNVNKILVGNKATMHESKRAVPTSKGQALADEYRIKFFETSAKTNFNVEQVFFSIATDIKQRLDGTDTKAEGKNLKIPLHVIKDCTEFFSERNFIGKGGYGRVYKGILTWAGHVNQLVAVKRLDVNGFQGNKEFLTEVTMLSRYQHENVITLIGFCDDDKEMILVYEYASHGSLDTYLSGDIIRSGVLSWPQLLQICIGVASALEYLHNHVAEKHRIIHRDIKSANVLLDENWNAKLADFGLAKIGLANQQDTFVITNIAGTHGYNDPQYEKTGILTKESDVYSFGVVLFEVLCGRLACVGSYNDERRFLRNFARTCYKNGQLANIIDHRIKKDIKPRTLSKFSAIAYQCLKETREQRPTIAEVAFQLKEAWKIQVSFYPPRPDIAFAVNRVCQYMHAPTNLHWQAVKRILRYLNGTLTHCLHFTPTTSSSLLAYSDAGWMSDSVTSNPESLLNKAAEIGGGIIGTVYKASLGEEGRDLAIKNLIVSNMVKSNDDFNREVRVLSKARHPNLVSIKGYFWKPELQLLVTEYVSNGSLQSKLHDQSTASQLSWSTRFKILLGTANGLAHLHHSFDPPIVHYNIKANNILLDENFNPKISDFGSTRIMVKLDKQVMSKRFQSALGYVAPELACQSLRVNEKCDVYGFGVLILEVLTGKRSIEYRDDNVLILSEEVRVMLEEGNVLECVDLRMGEYREDEVLPVLKLALVCTSQIPSSRPSMAEVVQILQVVRAPVHHRMEAY